MKLIIEIKDAEIEDGGEWSFLYIFKKNIINDYLVSLISKEWKYFVKIMLQSYFFSKDGIFNFELIKNIKQFPQKNFF